MSQALSTPTFEPLDEDAMKHGLALAKSKLCARPVLRNGRLEFLKEVCHVDNGGSVETRVYLAGDPNPYPSHEIAIPDLPT